MREIIKAVALHFVIGFFADVLLMTLDDSESRSLSNRVADTVIIHKRQPESGLTL